jgi:hypothetical protein
MSWSRTVSPWGILAVLALVIGVASVSSTSEIKTERYEAAKKVTPDSIDDATQPIVDEDYRFQLDWPGKGWKLLRQKDASKVLPDAVAVAVSSAAHSAGVIVEQAPGATASEMLDLVTANLAAENVEIESRGPYELAGNPGERVVLAGTRLGIRFRFVIVGLTHQDHFYQLFASGIADQTKVSDLQPFFDHFSLLPGKVVARERSSATLKDQHGLGWVLEGGDYRSAVTGITANPEDGWRVVVGQELEMMSPDAAIGLVRGNPEAYVVLLAERVDPENAKAFAQHLRNEFGATLGTAPAEEPRAAEFAGSGVELQRYPSGHMEFLHGVHVRDDLAVQVLAWYATGMRERSEPEVDGGLRSFGFLTADERTALRSELTAKPDPQNSVGPGWAIRSGEYRDFANHFTWTAPPGFWRMGGGEKARAAMDGSLLSVMELEHGIHGIINAGDTTGLDADGWREAAESMWVIDVRERDVIEGADGRPIGRTFGQSKFGDFTYDFVIGHTMRGAVGVSLTLWGPLAWMEEHPDAMTGAFEGLRLVDELPEWSSGTRYEDHRFGFALDPPDGYRLRDETPPQIDATGRMLFWSRGKRLVGVIALCVLGQGQDEEWFEGFIEQSVMQRFVESVDRGAMERSTAELAGRRGRRFTWESRTERFDAILVSERRTLYGLILANIDEAEAEKLRKSFATID